METVNGDSECTLQFVVVVFCKLGLQCGLQTNLPTYQLVCTLQFVVQTNLPTYQLVCTKQFVVVVPGRLGLQHTLHVHQLYVLYVYVYMCLCNVGTVSWQV
jgi:hypothetical protein